MVVDGKMHICKLFRKMIAPLQTNKKSMETEFIVSLDVARQLGSDAKIEWLCNWALIELQSLQVNAVPGTRFFDAAGKLGLYEKYMPDASMMLKRMVKYMSFSKEQFIRIIAATFFSMFKLLERFVMIDKRNFSTIFTGALTIAMKFECDVPYGNNSMAFFSLKLTTALVSRVELMFLGAAGILSNEFTGQYCDKQNNPIELPPFPLLYHDQPLYLELEEKIMYLFN